MTIKKIGSVMLAVFAVISLTGCFGVSIKSDVDYPAKLFQAKMAKIKAIQAKDPGRKGPVSKFKMLVYVEDERKLVSISIPKKLAGLISEIAEDAHEDKYVKKYAKDFDLEKFSDLEQYGPGLLAEIEVNDDEKVHVSA